MAAMNPRLLCAMPALFQPVQGSRGEYVDGCSDGFLARARSVHDAREATQAMRGEVRQRIPGQTR